MRNPYFILKISNAHNSHNIIFFPSQIVGGLEFGPFFFFNRKSTYENMEYVMRKNFEENGV